MSTLLFYFFATFLIMMSISSISVRTPVYAVLSLISAFVSTACLFFMIGAEYIAATTVIVYVGAVAVLFLFVVMMLDNDKKKITYRSKYNKYKILIAFLMFYIFYHIIRSFASNDLLLPIIDSANHIEQDNVKAIGKILYTSYFLPFQISALILLVAMVGAIVLTLRHKKTVKRQDIISQLSRSGSVLLVDCKSGRGVKL